MGRPKIACQVCLLKFKSLGKFKKHVRTKPHREQMSELFQEDVFKDRGHFPCIAIMQHLAKEDINHPIIGLSLMTLCISPGVTTVLYLCHVCEQKCSHGQILRHLFSDEHYSNYYNYTNPDVLSFCWIPSMNMRSTLKSEAFEETSYKGCGQLQVLDLPVNLFAAIEAGTYCEAMKTLNENEKLFKQLEAVMPKRVMIQTYQRDDSRKHPLLGLQHVVECVCVGQTEKRHYLCTLCHITLATHKIIKHVLSFDHIFCYFKAWHPNTLQSKECYKNYTKSFAVMMLEFAKKTQEIHGPAISDIKQMTLEPDMFASVNFSCYAEGLKILESIREERKESSLIVSIKPGNKLEGHTVVTSNRLRCQDCNMIFETVSSYCKHVQKCEHKKNLMRIFGQGHVGGYYDQKGRVPTLGMCKYLRGDQPRTEPVIGLSLIVLCLCSEAQVDPIYVCFACEDIFLNSANLIRQHLNSPKHLVHTLIYQNPERLPFAWEKHLDLGALQSLAWEEERARGEHDMLLKIFDVPHSIFNRFTPRTFANVLKKLRGCRHYLKCQVPKYDKVGLSQNFPLLGQNFMVQHNINKNKWAASVESGFLCLLCGRRLSEGEFYTHVFSREHVKAFLEYALPGSLDSNTENTETLLDFAKQAAKFSPVSRIQIIKMHKPICQPCSYQNAIVILEAARRREKKGPLTPVLLPKKKLVLTEAVKEAKDQVRDTSQNNSVMPERTERETGNESADKSETGSQPVPVEKEAESGGSSEQMKHCTGDESDKDVQSSVSCRTAQKRCADEDAQREVDDKRQRLCSEERETPSTGAQKMPEGQIGKDFTKTNTTNMGQSGKSTDQTAMDKVTVDVYTDILWNYVKMKCREPVIGLSALFECHCDQRDPFYLCESCCMKVSEEEIISHVTGYGHQVMHLVAVRKLTAPPERTEREKIRCAAVTHEVEEGYGEAQVVDLDPELYSDIVKQDFEYAIKKLKELCPPQEISHELPQTSDLPDVQSVDSSAITSVTQDALQPQVTSSSTSSPPQAAGEPEVKDPSELTTDLKASLSSSTREEPLTGVNMLTKACSEGREKSSFPIKCCSDKMVVSDCTGHLTAPHHHCNCTMVKTDFDDAGNLETQPTSAVATTFKTEDRCKMTEITSHSNGDIKMATISKSVPRAKMPETTEPSNTRPAASSSTTDMTAIHLSNSRPASMCTAPTCISTAATSKSVPVTSKFTATASASQPTLCKLATTSNTSVATRTMSLATISNPTSNSKPAVVSTAPTAVRYGAASKAAAPSKTGATLGRAPESKITPKSSETASKTMLTTMAARVSNADGDYMLTTARPDRSVHKATPTETSESSRRENRPSQNRNRVGLNFVVTVVFEGKMQIYCLLCSLRMKGSSHIDSSLHRHKYVTYKSPGWTAESSEYQTRLLEEVTRLARAEREAGIRGKKVEVTLNEYRELADLPEQEALQKVRAIMKQRELSIPSTHRPQDPRLKARFTSPREPSHPDDDTVNQKVPEPEVKDQPQVKITPALRHPVMIKQKTDSAADVKCQLKGESSDCIEEKPHESPDRLAADSETVAPAADARLETSERRQQREPSDPEPQDTHRPSDSSEKQSPLVSSSSDPESPSSVRQSPRGPSQTGGWAVKHTWSSLEQEELSAPHALPDNSEVTEERNMVCSHLSRYLTVKGLEAEPIIGLGFVFECRAITQTPFFLCGSCRKVLQLLQICEHIVSIEHQLQYMRKRFHHFLSLLWYEDLPQEINLLLLKEIAWKLSDREKNLKTDAQVTLLNKDWYERVQTAPYHEALNMLQALRREQKLKPLCLPDPQQMGQRSPEESLPLQPQSTSVLETGKDGDKALSRFQVDFKNHNQFECVTSVTSKQEPVTVKRDCLENMTSNGKKEELQPQKEVGPEAKHHSEDVALIGHVEGFVKRRRISGPPDISGGNSNVYCDASLYPAACQKTSENQASKPADALLVSQAQSLTIETQSMLDMKQSEVLSESPASSKFCLKSSQISVSPRDQFPPASPSPAEASVESFVSTCPSNHQLKDSLPAESTHSLPQPGSQPTSSPKPALLHSESTPAVTPSPLCPEDEDKGQLSEKQKLSIVDMEKFGHILTLLSEMREMKYKMDMSSCQESPTNAKTTASSTADLSKRPDKERCDSKNGLMTSEMHSASISTVPPASNTLKRKFSHAESGDNILNYENRQLVANPRSDLSTDNQAQDGYSGAGNHVITVVRGSADAANLPTASAASPSDPQVQRSVIPQGAFSNVPVTWLQSGPSPRIVNPTPSESQQSTSYSVSDDGGSLAFGSSQTTTTPIHVSLNPSDPHSSSGYNTTGYSSTSGNSQVHISPYTTNGHSSYGPSEAVAGYTVPSILPVYSGNLYQNEGYPTYIFPSQNGPQQRAGQAAFEGSFIAPPPQRWVYLPSPEQQQHPSWTHPAPRTWFWP